MGALETRIPPPLVALTLAIGMFVLARWWLLVVFEVPHPWFLGFLVALAGGVVSSAGALAFRKARTTVNPLHPERVSLFVASGVYRYTRNPMYLGLLFVLVGGVVALGALSAMLGPAAFVGFITRFQIVPEERVLEGRFGPEYIAYKERVRRWL